MVKPINRLLSVFKSIPSDKILKAIYMFITVVCAVLLLCLTGISLLRTTEMNTNNDWYENVEYQNDNLLLNLLILVLFFLLYYFLIKRFIDKINLRYVKYALVIWVALVGFLWVISVQSMPTHDAYIVTSAAREFANGNYNALSDYYLMNFPYQLGFAFYCEIIIRLFQLQDNLILFEFCNVIYLAVSYLALLNIVKLTFEKKSIYVFTAVLLAGCLQPVMFTTFIYGNIPGFMFAMLAVSHAVKYIKGNLKRDFILSALFIGISSILKLNSMIAVIGLCIIVFLHFLKVRKPVHILFIAAICISGLSMNTLVIKQYEWRAGVEMPSGVPMISWMAMGMNEAYIAQGWFDPACTTVNYQSVNRDAALASERSIAVIKERVGVFAENPGYALDFFSKKMISQWNEPTYQSIWINQARGHYLKPFGIGSYVCGEGEAAVKVLINYYQQFILCCSLLGVICILRRKNHLQLILPLIVLGGFAYHMLFEAKSQYILIYFIMLIPIAACGLDWFYRHIERVILKVKA